MKKNIAIVMGGYSSEAGISLKSGQVVYENLNKDKYVPHRVHILKDKWVYVDEGDREHPINKEDFSTTVNGYKIRFDAVFNAIHGHPGEDGTLLAYFDLLGMPHSSAMPIMVSSSLEPRAITMQGMRRWQRVWKRSLRFSSGIPGPESSM